MRLPQGKDSEEAYTKRFQKLVKAADVSYEFTAVHFRNLLNFDNTNLMLHHLCDISKKNS